MTELDTLAIRVRHPANVLLVGITRAGNRLVAVGEHGVIIYSDDNGGNWLQASVPIDLTLTCVAFASPLLGWAAGHFGVVLQTADGGKTWQMQLNGLDAAKLTLATAQDPATQSIASPAVELAERRAERFASSGPDKPFLSLLVLSPSKVIVFGAYRLAMITQDGGKTWAEWSLHIYDRLSHNIYDVQRVGSDIYLVSEAGLVFRSSDEGNSFQPLSSPGNVTLFGIVGPHDGSILVFGVAGACFRSTDRGQTWVPVALTATGDGTATGDVTAGRVLASGRVLLGSEGGALDGSADNGVSFTAIQGVGGSPIFDMEQAANGDIIIAGESGITVLPAQTLKS